LAEGLRRLACIAALALACVAARARDLRITVHTYTSGIDGLDTAGSTGSTPQDRRARRRRIERLDAAIPPWVREGGDEARIERLQDPEIRARIAGATDLPCA